MARLEPKTRYNTGQVGEFLVAAELARAGFSVALPVGNAPDIDLLAYRRDTRLAVQVKAVQHGAHQFNLGRFLKIEVWGDGKQRVLGALPDLDRDIFVALVFVGERSGEDTLVWTDLGSFVGLLEKSHNAYLEKHGGRRPGRNPHSLHAAIPRGEIENAFPHRDIDDFLSKR